MNSIKKDTQDNTCVTCYRIICKQCGWVASDEDAVRIQKGNLTTCPVCGWKPGD